MAERQGELPEDQRIAFRIGVNLGDIIIEDDDIHGDGVNVAARLEALAEPGGILRLAHRPRQRPGQATLPVRRLGRATGQEHPAAGARVPRRAGRRRARVLGAGRASSTPGGSWAAAAAVVLLLAAGGAGLWLRSDTARRPHCSRPQRP